MAVARQECRAYRAEGDRQVAGKERFASRGAGSLGVFRASPPEEIGWRTEMAHPTIEDIEKERKKEKLPEMRPGDTVRVQFAVLEGGKERTQTFEGVVLKRRSGGLSESITLRRVAHAVGVERTFPLHSPMVKQVELRKRGRVRRAKLYYLRERVGKAARIREER